MKSWSVRHPSRITETELVGELMDQAALLGLINALYDLGRAILFVERVERQAGPDDERRESN